MNNQKIMIAGGALVLLLLLGGGFFVLSSNKNTKIAPTPSADEQTIGKLSPADIGLEMIPRADGNAVKMVVKKVDDIKSFEYELTYSADIPVSERIAGEENQKVRRGLNGDVTIKSTDKEYRSDFLIFGSESKKVYRYDTGIEDVKIVMKIIKKDGKVYQLEDVVTL